MLQRPMGTEIVEESPKNPTVQKLKKPNLAEISKRLKNILTRIKRPKIVTVIILFMTIVLFSIALNVLSKKNAGEVVAPPVFNTNSPSPEASQDPSTENIAQRVKIYNEKLNNLKNFNQDLPKPIVDLAISFKE